MTTSVPTSSLQLHSLVKSDGELEVSLQTVSLTPPGPNEIIVRIDASPINPSDLGLLFGAADMSTARSSGTAERPIITARIPEAAMRSMAGRLNVSLPVGLEGAGLVVAAGASDEAQALLGKTVAMLGSGMYAQYSRVSVDQCLVLPAGATAAEGASSFVNPLTALGMVETMRREGHTALVHTAASSNLGQMLVRICQQDKIGLVNIVRRADQVDALKAIGAVYVCDSSAPTFLEDLTEALEATGATLAFDATGGGKLTGQILACMEAALNKTAAVYSRYGSTTHKQVYQYGGLDPRPTEYSRNFGMAWGIGGWLLHNFLRKVGPEVVLGLKQRVAAELKTTFASRYAGELSLREVLQPEHIAVYGKRATGAKYLLNPNKDLG